jgi:tryptophan-rich sensory protein
MKNSAVCIASLVAGSVENTTADRAATRSTGLWYPTAALTIFVARLVLNAIWSPLFFGGYPLFGTAALLLPYLAWTLYASTLNFCIALMN